MASTFALTNGCHNRYNLGKYIVAAPGICGGRPTFKYTRLEASMILAQLSRGVMVEQVVADYWRSKITPEAVFEAIALANQAFVASTNQPQLQAT